MQEMNFICFDCDQPLTEEALAFHAARCAACALAEYESAQEAEAEVAG